MAEEPTGLPHLRHTAPTPHSNVEIAKLPATLALVGSILSLALAIWALEKARSVETSVARSEAVIDTRK